MGRTLSPASLSRAKVEISEATKRQLGFEKLLLANLADLSVWLILSLIHNDGIMRRTKLLAAGMLITLMPWTKSLIFYSSQKDTVRREETLRSSARLPWLGQRRSLS